MPIILPYNDIVDWSVDEGTIGVIGVAPWATIDFLRSLYSQIEVTKDWQYPRVICDINTKIPSRGRYLELNERDPSPFIQETIMELYKQGATVAVVPCNTAHILYDKWSKASPIPIPSIIDSAVEAVYRKGIKKVLALTSQNLYKYNLYEIKLQEYGINCIKLSNEQILLISKIIEEIKIFSNISIDTQNNLNNLLKNIESNIGIILGCTELTSLAPLFQKYVAVVIDSNTELSKKALSLI